MNNCRGCHISGEIKDRKTIGRYLELFTDSKSKCIKSIFLWNWWGDGGCLGVDMLERD